MFYPDIKPHISPSAFAQWHRQRSAFIRSYFKGEKTPETAAMRDGKKVHALIEGGLLDATHRFEHHEQELVIELPNQVKVLGYPDSYSTAKDGVASFVDYKTGEENHWTREELASDLKMLCTAWLVWKTTGEPALVNGYIEWIPMEWDGKERVPVEDGEHKIFDVVYSSESLMDFEKTLIRTIDEINAEYPKFLESTDGFISPEDCAEYAQLELQKKEIEEKQKAIKERLQEQMQFGGVNTYQSDFGTFYITEKKTYEYPTTLRVDYKDMGLVLEDAEAISAAASAAKKNYELEAEPKSVTKSVGFRAKKEKK